MTRHVKRSVYMLSLFGIAVAAPMLLSTAANAQLSRFEAGSQVGLTPNCEWVDCNIPPKIEIPPRVIPFPCDPRVCDPIEFEPLERLELERPELERLSKPVLEEAIRRGNIQDAGRLQQLKEDDF